MGFYWRGSRGFQNLGSGCIGVYGKFNDGLKSQGNVEVVALPETAWCRIEYGRMEAKETFPH